MKFHPKCVCKAFWKRSLHSVLLQLLGSSCSCCSDTLAGRCRETQSVQAYVCDGDQNQQLFKGFLLPLACVSEVNPSSSEDTFRHFVVNFSHHANEVSQVLLSTRLQWETNYCQTTPMQKNPRLKLSLRLLRFCS